MLKYSFSHPMDRVGRREKNIFFPLLLFGFSKKENMNHIILPNYLLLLDPSSLIKMQDFLAKAGIFVLH